MRVRSLPYLMVLLFSVPVLAQPQVYYYKELQRLLPEGDFGAYKRGRPTGETSSMMGFATSWAQVIYRSDSGTSRSSISVKITDMVSIPTYMSMSGDIDKETETGYKKTVVYKTIRVLEIYDSSTGEGKLQLPVANRFLVEITGSGIESTRPLYGLLDKLNLDGLQKLGRQAQSP